MGNSNSSDDKAKKAAAVVGGVTLGVALGAVTFGAGYVVAASIAATGAGTAYTAHEANNSESKRGHIMLSNSGSGGSSSKASSPVWQNLTPYRGNIRSNNLSGSSRSYFTWDYTHNHIEKFNHLGKHVGAINAISGQLCGPAVPGRSISL